MYYISWYYTALGWLDQLCHKFLENYRGAGNIYNNLKILKVKEKHDSMGKTFYF